MSVITRYLFTQLCLALLLTWVALVALVALFDVLAGINDLRADYDSAAMFYYVGMLLPRRLYDLLPIAAMLSTLIVMGTLAGQRELIIFQSSGISRVRLISYFAVPLVVLSCCSVLLFDHWILLVST